MKSVITSVAAILVASVLSTSAFADGTVTLKIGGSPGAVHDTVGRLMARFIGKYLPGNPEIIIENVGGGSGLLLARQMESTEPGDGSVFGVTNAGMISTSVLTPDKTPFHADKVRWIGSFGPLPTVCAVTKASGVNSIDDLVKNPNLKLGATGNGSKLYTLPAIVKNIYKAGFQIVQGFEGMQEIHLAMERGEIDGVCGVTVNTFATTGFEEFSKIIGTFVDGLQYNGVPVPQIVPADTSDEDKAAIKLLVADDQVFAPFLMPGSADAKTVEAFQTAFTKATEDPEFKVEAAKVVRDAHPTTGAFVEQVVKDFTTVDPAVLARARELAQ